MWYDRFYNCPKYKIPKLTNPDPVILGNVVEVSAEACAGAACVGPSLTIADGLDWLKAKLAIFGNIDVTDKDGKLTPEPSKGIEMLEKTKSTKGGLFSAKAGVSVNAGAATTAAASGAGAAVLTVAPQFIMNTGPAQMHHMCRTSGELCD